MSAIQERQNRCFSLNNNLPALHEINNFFCFRIQTKRAKFDVLVKDALDSMDESNPQDQLNQDMRLNCLQVARELRVAGDALETRFQRRFRWRIQLEHFTCLELFKELLSQMLLNLLITWRDWNED